MIYVSQNNSQSAPPAPTKDEQTAQKIIVRDYPSTIYLWPSMVVGIFVWVIDYVIRYITEVGKSPQSVDTPEFQAYVASIWLILFIFNLTVMSFDFGVGRTFTLLITVVLVVVLYIGVIDTLKIQGLPNVNEMIIGLGIGAKANFYLAVSILLGFLFIITSISVRFNYWEFTSNRIIHHRGIFEREESFSAQNSRVITRVDDIFERILFRAGTVTIVDSEKNVHVLKNVYNAIGKDKVLDLDIRIRKE